MAVLQSRMTVSGGHVQHLRCFSDGETAKEPQFNDLAHTRIDRRQLGEGIAEGDEVALR